MKSYFIDDNGVKIHVLEEGSVSVDTPTLLVVCGIWEPAERAIPVLSGLSSHVVSFSFRGRGLSSTPEFGYDLEEHLSDIEAVVDALKLEKYCILGFSRGASYAWGWTVKHHNEMSGLIIVDQPPIHRAMHADAVPYWMGMVYQGVPLLNYMRQEAVEGLAREARTVEFADQLCDINIPVRVFYGADQSNKIPSNLEREDIDLYESALTYFSKVEFSKSGHMIPDDEPERYIEEVKLFLGAIQ
ncbi:alpha/beta fold hydrolase [Fusibacter sp. 3D3]|uniref:alpha/beta fold hydrolase n=1 Tax=Fusibacter sp. 3D3 TaxID=1048380 RepID=UPI000853E238|nr:alpha/beta hydrolase [Fusibacter sp. 3D3]GAU79138.1 alpha/beta hydrolase fold precursor [Fusibacter sp. 3D3]